MSTSPARPALSLSEGTMVGVRSICWMRRVTLHGWLVSPLKNRSSSLETSSMSVSGSKLTLCGVAARARSAMHSSPMAMSSPCGRKSCIMPAMTRCSLSERPENFTPKRTPGLRKPRSIQATLPRRLTEAPSWSFTSSPTLAPWPKWLGRSDPCAIETPMPPCERFSTTKVRATSIASRAMRLMGMRGSSRTCGGGSFAWICPSKRPSAPRPDSVGRYCTATWCRSPKGLERTTSPSKVTGFGSFSTFIRKSKRVPTISGFSLMKTKPPLESDAV